jgi:hypothetical protein
LDGLEIHVFEKWGEGSKYDFDRHMTKLVAVTVAALIFRRHDIATAQNWIEVVTTRNDVLEEAYGNPRMAFSMITHALGSPENTWMEPYVTLIRGVKRKIGHTHSVPALPEDPHPTYTTDTEELVWELGDAAGSEFVKADTLNCQIIVGHLADNVYQFEEGILADGSITVGSIESTALIAVILKETSGGTSTYIIIATGETENTDQKLDDEGEGYYSLNRWGEAPVLVEGINAYITLHVAAENVDFYALDPQGRRKTDLPVEEIGENCGLQLSSSNETLCYEVVVT